MTAIQGTGSFTFERWEETEGGTASGGAKLAHASVTNTFTGVVEAAGTSCTYVIAYDTEKTGSFVGYQLLDGTVDGRRGSFFLEERGAFGEDGTVRCTFTVVGGSGTGELGGLAGSGGYTARHGEASVAYTAEFTLS
ncbi:DUF3224 domain-containing protein [Streptomyces sp. NPDC060194]|uniref:DUF3224 domain-containing protein n=1 Tax=Streptomyces sp. NPDC060194 TaxID=3347069 RepID=UPI003665446F